MGSSPTTWMEKLARGSAGRAQHERAVSPIRQLSTAPNESTGITTGFSRANVVRFGLAGAASLLLAGLRPPSAAAFTRDECIQQCQTKYREAHDRAFERCNALYFDSKSVYNTDSGWS